MTIEDGRTAEWISNIFLRRVGSRVGNESAGEWLELENKAHECDLRLSDQLSAMAGLLCDEEGGKNL